MKTSCQPCAKADVCYATHNPHVPTELSHHRPSKTPNSTEMPTITWKRCRMLKR
jgi:hypothetical protein